MDLLGDIALIVRGNKITICDNGSKWCVCVCVCVCVLGMEINTRHTPFAGGFVWWRVNCVTSPATVSGNTFQSGPIKFAYLIHSSYGAAVLQPLLSTSGTFFYASFAEMRLSTSGIIEWRSHAPSGRAHGTRWDL